MTELTSAQRTKIAQQFIEGIPHAHALGMEITSVGDGRAVMTMGYSPQLIGDPETGVIAGGAVFTLLDTCSGAAVISHPSGSNATATLDLRVDYMRPAKPGDTITAKAECYHVTRSVAFVRVVATDGDSSRPIAAATGAFVVNGGEAK